MIVGRITFGPSREATKDEAIASARRMIDKHGTALLRLAAHDAGMAMAQCADCGAGKLTERPCPKCGSWKNKSGS